MKETPEGIGEPDMQRAVIRRMSPAQRLQGFVMLYNSARRIKAAAVQSFHPDWSPEQVESVVREAFLHGRS